MGTSENIGHSELYIHISGVRFSGHRVKPNMAAMEAMSYVGFSPLRGLSCLRVT